MPADRLARGAGREVRRSDVFSLRHRLDAGLESIWWPIAGHACFVQTCWKSSGDRGPMMRVLVTAIAAVGILPGAGFPATDAAGAQSYLERAQSGTVGNVQISAAALSAEESRAVYGVPLARKLIQPVWIEIENKEDVPYWLLFPGV